MKYLDYFKTKHFISVLIISEANREFKIPESTTRNFEFNQSHIKDIQHIFFTMARIIRVINSHLAIIQVFNYVFNENSHRTLTSMIYIDIIFKIMFMKKRIENDAFLKLVGVAVIEFNLSEWDVMEWIADQKLILVFDPSPRFIRTNNW